MTKEPPINPVVSLDFLKKTIERERGKGWCDQHQCALPDKDFTCLAGTVNVYEECPRCLQEKEAEAKAGTAKLVRAAMREGLTRAGIPPRYLTKRLSDFTATTPAAQEVLHIAEVFCGHHEQEYAPESLLIVGTVGTGKTLLGCAILTEWMYGEEGDWMDTGLYATAAQILRRIKMTWRKDSSETEQQVMSKLAQVSLLVIDEVGVQFNSDTERLLLTELVNDRYNHRRATILISNLTIKEFTQTVGDRIVDRFKEGGKVLICDWQSHRGA